MTVGSAWASQEKCGKEGGGKERKEGGGKEGKEEGRGKEGKEGVFSFKFNVQSTTSSSILK